MAFIGISFDLLILSAVLMRIRIRLALRPACEMGGNKR